jgi:excisionase family DNA binding protein
MTTNRPLTLTVEQTAELLGISRSTAYELVNTGQLECLRLRRRVVVPTSRVAEWLGISMPEIWSALPSDRPF